MYAGINAMIYHGVNSGTCIATSQDEALVHWQKYPANLAISLLKEGDPDYGVYHVWDTRGWVDGDFYYSILDVNLLSCIAYPLPIFYNRLEWDKTGQEMGK